MKRLFTFFFALLSACTFSAYAAVVDGTCGDNLTWTLNTKDSTLVISGTGAMADNPSWSDYKIYIKYVTLPDGLTSIGNSAFDGCSDLTSITIPNSVTSIGDYAFSGCSGLTSITIPNNVTSIGFFAFFCCHPSTIIITANSIEELCNSSINSLVKAISYGNKKLLVAGKELTELVIPNSVTSLNDEVFCGCSGLTSIIIPNNVTSIGQSAFSDCEGLTSVTIGSGVMSIGNGAFAGCSGIQEVTSYASTPPAAASCGLNHTSCTLYVPAEYIGTYSNTIWWEDFKEIRTMDADYVVTFFDWDNTVLARVAVAAGEAATAPADPVREGYTFIGWDKDFSFVNSNLDVYAQYQMDAGERDMTLVFKDQDNTQISTQSITVMFPPVPEIEGFTFLYWQTITARVDDVITIQAVYESNTPT